MTTEPKIPQFHDVSCQQEIVDFIKNELKLEIKENLIINDYHTQIFVESANVAIDCYELNWYQYKDSPIFDNKKLLRKKYLEFKSHGIRSIQFHSDEWYSTKEICKSVIRSALKAIEVKLNARDCEIKQIDSKEANQFFEENHVSGGTRARYYVGLFHPDHGLVGAASVRTPIQKKYGVVSELARLATLRNISVRGGASKLIKNVLNYSANATVGTGEKYIGMLSYAELRYGDGGVYEHCGFKLVNSADTNYWYTNGEIKENRFKYRAQKPKTEKEVADENHVRPIYGAGNNIYICMHNQQDPVLINEDIDE